MNITYKLFTKLSAEDKALRKSLTNLLGYKPSYLPFYVSALTHKSYSSENLTNNERLEFLGDAYIGSVVGEYIFMKYPAQDEGFLTEMRSKIVSRQSLNNIALKMGLHKLVRYNSQDRLLGRSHIFGNALEALVGAIFLDKGYKTTSKFLKEKLIGTYVDVDELEVTEFNFKNRLYTWSQKNNYHIDFTTVDESYQAGRKVFKVAINVEGQFFIEATGYTKKQASQTAAQKALEFLDINPDTKFEYASSLKKESEIVENYTNSQESEKEFNLNNTSGITINSVDNQDIAIDEEFGILISPEKNEISQEKSLKNETTLIPSSEIEERITNLSSIIDVMEPSSQIAKSDIPKAVNDLENTIIE